MGLDDEVECMEEGEKIFVRWIGVIKGAVSKFLVVMFVLPIIVPFWVIGKIARRIKKNRGQTPSASKETTNG